MASQHISIVGSESRMAGKVRSAVDEVRRCVETVDRLKDTLDQIASGADWAALALSLGWTDTADNRADAEVVYNLLGSAKAKLDDAAVSALTDRLG